jgi:hypothetical protein
MAMVFDNLFPVLALIAPGSALHRSNFINEGFLTVSDRPVHSIRMAHMNNGAEIIA